ncbi:alpha/beta hydrolase [Caulobacter sp.]|uniref:alpha/beta fold hydrolase n=1 Tax=Caulobacter sp. TaxID=78 RepID=UPI001B12124E|nr:alpha/beta hydrolase [Caulobacter sp.]MBO9543866.1 alpha/beta hydrolase [Caulobacter sp.]
MFRGVVLAVALLIGAAPGLAAEPADATAHKTSFVTTSDGLKLEVLDYGGAGSPILLISGGGRTAHDFDAFAPRLAARHHVYAVTRRGLGASDKPPLNPEAHTLSRLTLDDVEVLDALKLPKATLAGWSLGGAELSGLARHHRDRVTALIYLDAAYAYAFYAPANAYPDAVNVEIDLADLRDKLQAARSGSKQDAARIYDEVLAKDLVDLATDIRAAAERRRRLSKGLAEGPPAPLSRLMTRQNMEKFPAVTGIPILAIFAIPAPEPNLTPAERDDETLMLKWRREQIGRYRAAHPAARIVEIAGADHDVFNSHPDIVLREIDALLDQAAP